MVLTGHLPFDFRDYLYNLTGANWDVRELSGGNANFVVRATQARPTTNERPAVAGLGDTVVAQKLLAHTSIVLKQAPPYFAKFPGVQFSQKRQVVEARTLDLFKTEPQLSNVVKDNNKSIHIPSLLHHDEAQHVLVQSELGSHPLLDAYLSSPSTTAHSAALAGHSLGHFLANLNQTYDSASDALSPPSSLAAALTYDDAESVMQGVIANATRFMREAGVHDWEILGARALEHWKSRKRTAFCQGDIWFGTIMVDDTAPTRVNEEGRSPVLKICDWEFAGPNHPAADIAQLGAYLHMSSLSTLRTAPQQPMLDAFAASFYAAYFRLSDSSRTTDHDRREFQRSLLLLHGWELVNAAAWRDYLWCDCPGKEVKCEHIQEMVKVGATLLRAAGDDGEQMDRELARSVDWVSAYWGNWADGIDFPSI